MPLVHKADGVRHLRAIPSVQSPRSAFTGFRFPPEVILIAVRGTVALGRAASTSSGVNR